MSSSILHHRLAVADIPVLEAKPWRDDLLRRHHAGARIVTLFGRKVGEDALLTSVFLEPSGGLVVTRMRTSIQLGYHELTSELPALHGFERELHEQTGVRIAGHPWLKPVRHEGPSAPAMAAYPYYAIEGKEVHEVAVGPIHAGVIEPGSFRFLCLGEQVHHLEIQLGYQHRGVEARLLEGDARRVGPLVETVAGDTSVANAWAYGAAIESLAGEVLPLEVDVARAVALELERVAMHLASLSGLAADLGFLQGATTYGRLRTTAINTTMRLCGSRFGRGAIRPGGIGMRLPPDLLRDVLANVERMRADLAIIDDRFLGSQTVQDRLRGVGVVSSAQATELGLVGLVARASGLAVDVRRGGGGAFGVIPVEVQVLSSGDCWARARVRIAELHASLAWLRLALALYGRWELPRVPIGALAPDQLVVTVVEGWRGEVVHVLETDGVGSLLHYKVQDPSLRNWMGLALALRGNEISDFPICNKSFDLSYCGNDL